MEALCLFAMILRFIQGLLWRVYQMALIVTGLFIFWNVMGEGESNYPIVKIFSSFAFGVLFSIHGTLLTVRAIDRFRNVARNKRLDYFS
jgi:hypothetical protein